MTRSVAAVQTWERRPPLWRAAIARKANASREVTPEFRERMSAIRKAMWESRKCIHCGHRARKMQNVEGCAGKECVDVVSCEARIMQSWEAA